MHSAGRPERAERPWVLVCGGFHDGGGMDRLNAALARHLARRGTPTHLVGHDVDPAFDAMANVNVTRVARPFGSYLAGEAALAAAARRLCKRMSPDRPVLLGNGGAAMHADVNWVHSVHHAWHCADRGAPAWFRAKNRAFKAWSRQREASALASARTIVANSQRTKEDIVSLLGVGSDRVRVAYPGTADSWRPPDPTARAAARALWCRDARPLAVLVGAVGHDTNKGQDVLIAAWTRLVQEGGWDAALVVAGPGNASRWRAAAGDGDGVRFAGRIDDVGTLLDAADLIVSPVRYESYGLAVHEAICRGVPPLVSRTAGVAERFPTGSDLFLLDAPVEPAALADRLRRWRADVDAWRRLAEPIGARLRAATMDGMCARVCASADVIERGALQAS